MSAIKEWAAKSEEKVRHHIDNLARAVERDWDGVGTLIILPWMLLCFGALGLFMVCGISQA